MWFCIQCLAETLTETRGVLMSLFVFWLLYMRSTFPGTELNFLLKLTRQPKNNLPLETEGEREGESEEREKRE